MSLNFSYEVKNAFTVVLVQTGKEAALGVVTPQGTLRGPTIGTDTPLGTGGLAISGVSDGLANFEFEMKPHGAESGTLTFLFVPAHPAIPISTAKIGDLSFELDTWTNAFWPNVPTPYGLGHLYDVSPNVSSRQMDEPRCRSIASGGVRALVCEDWTVLVHSPLDDAETMNLVDASGSTLPALKGAKASYVNPHRATSDFSSALVVPTLDAGGLAKLGLSIPSGFKTNGRFWEQQTLPRAATTNHAGTTQVQILDNGHGHTSKLFDHVDGAVPVSPYVPFANEALVLGGSQMSLTDADADGVPQLSFGLPSDDLLGAATRVVRFGDADDANAAVPGAKGGLALGTSGPGGFKPFCVLPSPQAAPKVIASHEMSHDLPPPVVGVIGG
jgi:hypothetical protein